MHAGQDQCVPDRCLIGKLRPASNNTFSLPFRGPYTGSFMLHPRANAMMAFALPVLIIGSASSLVLLMVMKLADALQPL